MKPKQEFKELVATLKAALPEEHRELADQVHRAAGEFRREISHLKGTLAAAEERLTRSKSKEAELCHEIAEIRKDVKIAVDAKRKAEKLTAYLKRQQFSPLLTVPKLLELLRHEQSIDQAICGIDMERLAPRRMVDVLFLNSTRYQQLFARQIARQQVWSASQCYAIYVMRLHRLLERIVFNGFEPSVVTLKDAGFEYLCCEYGNVFSDDELPLAELRLSLFNENAFDAIHLEYEATT